MAATRVARNGRFGPGPSLTERVLALVIPIVVTLGLIGLGLIFAREETNLLLTHAGVSFIILGKLIVLGASIPDNPFSYWELALLVVYMDTLTGVIWIYNMDILFGIPRVGPALRRLRIRARRTLQANPWLRKLSYLGVVLFVTFPLTGTGAVGGSLMGKFMGIHRFPHLVAIAAGGAVGGFAIAALAAALGRENAQRLVGDHPFIMAGILVALLLLLALAGRLLLRRR